MGKISTREFVNQRIAEFLHDSGMCRTRLGREAMSDQNVIGRITRGKAVSLGTIDKIEKYIERWYAENQIRTVA